MVENGGAILFRYANSSIALPDHGSAQAAVLATDIGVTAVTLTATDSVAGGR